jgi:hypothetical protein
LWPGDTDDSEYDKTPIEANKPGKYYQDEYDDEHDEGDGPEAYKKQFPDEYEELTQGNGPRGNGDTSIYDAWARKAKQNPPQLVLPKYDRQPQYDKGFAPAPTQKAPNITDVLRDLLLMESRNGDAAPLGVPKPRRSPQGLLPGLLR